MGNNTVEIAEAYKGIFEHAPIGIIRYDTNGVIKDCNPAFAGGIGVEKKRLLGFDMLKNLKDERLLAEIKKSLRGEEGYYEGKYVSVLTGKATYARGLFRAIRDEKGNIIGGLGILEDIGDKKRAEEELKNIKNLLQVIVKSMPQSLIAVNNEMKIIIFNEHAEIYSGLKAEDVLGQNLLEAVPEMKIFENDIEESISKGKIIEKQRVSCRKEGEERFVDFVVYPITYGKNPGAVILIDDVTSRVKMEEMVIQSEKMLSVGGLAAGMAHEINNPLAAIVQGVELIQEIFSVNSPISPRIADEVNIPIEAVRAYVEKGNLHKIIEGIHSSAFRAADIVQNMLSFARKGGNDFEFCDIRELFDKTIDLARTDYNLKKKFDFKNIEIFKEYDGNVDKILCSPSKIQQFFSTFSKTVQKP